MSASPSSNPAGEKINPTLKLALEMGPVILFVLAYSQGDRIAEMFGLTGILQKPIFLATAVIMVAMLFQSPCH